MPMKAGGEIFFPQGNFHPHGKINFNKPQPLSVGNKYFDLPSSMGCKCCSPDEMGTQLDEHLYCQMVT